MKKFKLSIGLILLIVWTVFCVLRHRRKQDETIQKFNKTTGEAIAVDYLIQKYEKEHKKFYEKEIGDGEFLEWPALDNENLSEYCKKFLHCSIPGRKSDTATGFKIRRVLLYEKENMSNSKIVIVHCKILMSRLQSYYMTRAPEPNCVYAVTRTNREYGSVFTIIHKHCDLQKRFLKWKLIENVVSKKHRLTGQPIAKDKYLLNYELEHQLLFNKKENNGNHFDWSHAKLHGNLDSFCQQYIGEIAPCRKQEHIKGVWRIDKLQYQLLNTHEIVNVTIIVCAPYNGCAYSYHMTKAPEENCVYALMRKTCSAFSPFCIIFKHCDFEKANGPECISQDYSSIDKMVIPRTEKKEETFNMEKTLQLLPNI